MHGWVPLTVQVVAAVVLLLAVGLALAPLAAVCGCPWRLSSGALLAAWAHWYIAAADWPTTLRRVSCGSWIALTGWPPRVLVVGWRSARWWRRGASVLAVPLCLLSAALALNLWVGYFPTVQTAWNQLTAGPLPDQTDMATVTAMAAHGTQSRPRAAVVPVTIPDDASNFKHRSELVYLPPAWFATNPPPKLPTVMMIGGEFNTPADWLRTGNAIEDDRRLRGRARRQRAGVRVRRLRRRRSTTTPNASTAPAATPPTTSPRTSCRTWSRPSGSARDRANWGIVGWSMGGTCAVDLTAMHPELFSSFVDIAGDLAPERRHQGRRPSTGSSAAMPPPMPRSTRRRSSPNTARTRMSRAGSRSRQYARRRARTTRRRQRRRDRTRRPGRQRQPR